MNYLVINGSPRKGNTWEIAELIKSELHARSQQTKITEIHLLNINLPLCTGCSLCFRKGHEHCPHYETVQKTIDAIDDNDGIVFSITTANMQPIALFKNWMDHLCFMLHRPRFFTKRAIVISTTGGVGAKSTVKYVGGTLSAMGFNKCYLLPVASYSWNCYEPNEKTLSKCRKVALRFFKDVEGKKLRPPSFTSVMTYNLFRGMSLAYVKGTEYETQDGAHWTDPVRANSAYDRAVPLPLHKRIFGNIFYGIGKIAGRSVQVTYKK